MAVTNKGLETCVARELELLHNIDSAIFDNRLYFPWQGGRCPVVHGASRLVAVFAVFAEQELTTLRMSEDPHEALAALVEDAARLRLRKVLPSYMLLCAEDEEDPGANPPGRKISFAAGCRVSQGGAEKLALGDRADWVRLKRAVRQAIQAATGWVQEPRAADAEVGLTAFFAADHITLGVEVKEVDTDLAPAILWSHLPRPGMQTAIAGAMAALAAESVAEADPDNMDESVVVDPTCGMGTLLIAAARVWPQLCQKRLRLIGREMNPNQLKKCYSNFSSCHLDTGDLRLGDARDGRAFAEVADASVDALLCDLPSGGAHKASSDWESYTSFMKLAERIVRPHGRCVLLSERKGMLLRTISKDAWEKVASWVVGRGQVNTLEFLLVVLKRRPAQTEQGPGRKSKGRSCEDV